MHLSNSIRESLSRRDDHGLDNEGDADMGPPPSNEGPQPSASEQEVMRDDESDILMSFTVPKPCCPEFFWAIRLRVSLCLIGVVLNFDGFGLQSLVLSTSRLLWRRLSFH